MKKLYDSSWNLICSKKGNLPRSEKALNKKYQEWKKRDWKKWLEKNLAFPFVVVRKEDEDDTYFTDIAKHTPFRLGYKMPNSAVPCGAMSVRVYWSRKRLWIRRKSLV